MAEARARKKPVQHSASYYRRRAESLERQAKRAKEMAERKEKQAYNRRVKQVKAYRDSPTHRRKILAGVLARERAAGRSGTFKLGIFPKPRKRRKVVRKPGPRRPKKKVRS